MHNKLIIKGARQHNLKNIDLELEKDSLIVISGLSGSGKSSLAFDTIFAEGQRRYVESLSAYARQFLGRLEKPAVDNIEGLSPSIAIEQKTTNKNPRSIVGTVSEIYDYYRLLWARVGIPHCPQCHEPISEQSIDQILDAVYNHEEGSRLMILAPVVLGRKGEHKKIFSYAKKEGYTRIRIDGRIYPIDEVPSLTKTEKHTIEVVIDRLILSPEIRSRLADSVERAVELSDGLVTTLHMKQDRSEELTTFSQRNSCVHCGISLPDLEPRLFSFNNPFGACPECTGLGYKKDFDPDKLIPDYNKSFNERAIATHNPEATHFRIPMEAFAAHYGFSLDTPLAELGDEIIDKILYGDTVPLKRMYQSKDKNTMYTSKKPFEGIIPGLHRRYRETGSSYIRQWMESFMNETTCTVCHGEKLNPSALSVLINGKTIWDVTRLSVKDALSFFEHLSLNETQKNIAQQVLKEIISRLLFLKNVGLDYLTLDRSTGTLSGGESQRIRLATQIGSALTGVMYVLDEPSIGLHQKDNFKLIEAMKALRDIGNTLIVVEHDEMTMREADCIVDLGPGAGAFGGYVTAVGTAEQIMKVKESITGQYLAKTLTFPPISERRKGNGKNIVLKGAKKNNLQGIDVSFKLGAMNVITGVSGSGKSTLLHEILIPALHRILGRQHENHDGYREIEGSRHIDKVISIDQSPIGRTPRSNPATYVGAFTPIRDLYASLPEAKMKGYKPGRFSFNVAGGRCEHCKGDGYKKIEMNFLPDVYVTCEVCKGKRFNNETLGVYYKGKNIYDVLQMSVQEASEFFSSIPSVYRKLSTLNSVGLGYIKLGQSALTLSGGEAQRVKLSSELAKIGTGNTLYVLDEPTTGLHFADVKVLMDVLNRIVDKGNTVILVEHNLDVIIHSDYIIDLGPDGGDKGGELVACGTPEEVALCTHSHTGYYIRQSLYENS